MLNRRRRRWGQGWGSRHYAYDSASVGSDDEVVHLVSRGEWGQQHDNNGRNGTNTVASTSADDEGYRGLLSVVVEFLFGPSPFPPGPTELERWKLRGAVIIALSSKASQQGVSLEELAPYSDNPPASLEDISSIVSEGLRVVSHFNGVPVLEGNDATTCSRSTCRTPPRSASFLLQSRARRILLAQRVDEFEAHAQLLALPPPRPPPPAAKR